MELNAPTDRDYEALYFEMANASEAAGPDFDLAAELSELDEAEQIEEALRAGGYYDESDRQAFEMGHR